MHRLHATTLLATLLLATPARADEGPPPSMFACGGKKAGDACSTDEGPGTCVNSTCSRLDYSKGTPPGVVSSDCLKCQKSAPPEVTAPTPPAPAPPAPRVDASTPAPASPATAPAPQPTSGCRVHEPGGAELLLLLGLAGLRRRRAA